MKSATNTSKQPPSTIDEELGLISEEEYAAFRGWILQSVRNERSLGKGPPFVKLGNTIKYFREGVKKFVAANTVTPERQPTFTEQRRARRRQRA